jgi:hypothetical protein
LYQLAAGANLNITANTLNNTQNTDQTQGGLIYAKNQLLFVPLFELLFVLLFELVFELLFVSLMRILPCATIERC